MISENRFAEIVFLQGGAENANQHCVWNTNEMNAFHKGLQAAIDILNAENDEEARKVSTSIR